MCEHVGEEGGDRRVFALDVDLERPIRKVSRASRDGMLTRDLEDGLTEKDALHASVQDDDLTLHKPVLP